MIGKPKTINKTAMAPHTNLLALKPLHHLNIIQLQMTLRRHDILYLPNLFFFHFLSGFQTVLFNVGRLVIRVCEEIEAAAFWVISLKSAFILSWERVKAMFVFPVLASILCTFPKPSMKYRFPS